MQKRKIEMVELRGIDDLSDLEKEKLMDIENLREKYENELEQKKD